MNQSSAIRRGCRRRPCHPRAGQSLVEFAVVALVLYLLLAATIEFGRIMFASQALQSAADLCAREISRTPLPPVLSFEEALIEESPVGTRPVKDNIYDPHYLVLDLDTLAGRPTLQALVAALPVVNQQLVPLMVYSEVGGRRLLRYPGALLVDTDNSDDPADPEPAGLLVAVPLVESRDASGVETIRWVNVVEDIQQGDEAALSGEHDPTDPFNILSTQRGLVAVRINYPFQAATLSSFRTSPDGPFEPNIGYPNIANDGGVTELDAPPGGTPIAPDVPIDPATGQPLYAGTYGGAYGLGEQGALNSPQLAIGFPLRPFRRVLSAQAIFRREVFAP
jgi:hypothetical protein